MRNSRRTWRSHVVRRPEVPLGASLPSATACLGLFLATRVAPTDRPRPFRNVDRVLEALGHGALRADDTIRVEARTTTVGRFLVGQCLPAAYREDVQAGAVTAARLHAILGDVTRDQHVEIAARCAEALETLGRAFADRSGFSVAYGDFEGPSQRDAIVAAAMSLAQQVAHQGRRGWVTDLERSRKTIDVWHVAMDQLRAAARAEAPAKDVLAALASSQLGSAPPEELRTMLGTVAGDGSGCEWECPVLHSRAEGLTPHELMMTCRAARRETLAQTARDAVAATLLHDLHAVLGETAISARDCGTSRGVWVARLEPEGEGLVVPLAARIDGRILAEDMVAADGTVVASSRAIVTPSLAARIESSGVAAVLLLDPMTCEAEGGVCAACFGLDPDDATWPAVGDEVGSCAAMRIAEAARTMTSRHTHVC